MVTPTAVMKYFDQVKLSWLGLKAWGGLKVTKIGLTLVSRRLPNDGWLWFHPLLLANACACISALGFDKAPACLSVLMFYALCGESMLRFSLIAYVRVEGRPNTARRMQPCRLPYPTFRVCESKDGCAVHFDLTCRKP